MDLHWTYLGYADDTPEMRTLRLKQSNLVGPAGYVSMEDGCVGGFVQRGTDAAEDQAGVVMMGGSGFETQTTRATETAIRGFWKVWRGLDGGVTMPGSDMLLRVAALNTAYADLHRRRPAGGLAGLFRGGVPL